MPALRELWTAERLAALGSFADRCLADPKTITRLEAIARFREVAPELPSGVFEASAIAAYEALAIPERADALAWLADEAGRVGARLPSPAGDDGAGPTPETAGAMLARVEREQPRVLDQVIGVEYLAMPVKLLVAEIAARGARWMLADRR